ncbi:MAG: lipooligosaccharide transport system permease protein [Frankiales bacterium]|jgi:lipooligosaccharide transport system permease protein|nr:lipooligosaccharide transport system permease protein [Frankiales bacterium]
MADTLVLGTARQVVVRHWWVVRSGRPWATLVNGLFEPFLYLMSIGVGIGTLIGPKGDDIAGGYSYASFVAPALLATSAMNTASNETIWGIWFRLQTEKFFDSLVTTPMSPADIAAGETAAATVRGFVAGGCFLGVLAALGMVHSWFALLGLPAVALISFTFAAAGIWISTLMTEMHHTQYVQLVMLPMFLFSATFYPLSVYPTWLADLVRALPLYQSTNLLRGLTLGDVGRPQLGAAVYLLVLGCVALWFAARRLGGLLLH